MVPILAIVAAFLALSFPVNGQTSSPCTASMLSSFTPCINFVTNSTTGGASPTSDCCNSLKSLTGGSMGCLCLIVTGSVPFQIPINRTLAVSLPKACNMPGVPLQCKASAAPVPAPGPAALGPTLAPGPKASEVPEPTSSAQPPESDDTPTTQTALSPPSSSTVNDVPTSTTGSRPVLTPASAAIPSFSFAPSLLYQLYFPSATEEPCHSRDAETSKL